MISAIICTYNRADLLQGALESLCQQTLDPAQFEILLIDNASTDHTAQVVAGFLTRYSNLHYFVEPQQGLSHARNRGLAEANGRFVAYLDDDALAPRDWLETAVSVIQSNPNPVPDCIGGPYAPYYSSPKPAWFKDKYAAATWGDVARPFVAGESLSGSNMIWQTAVLRSLGGFNVDLGVQGDQLLLGEETEAFKRLWQQKPSAFVLYDPKLEILHWVPPAKMKIRYQLARAFVAGQVSVQLSKPPLGKRPLLFLKNLAALGWDTAIALAHIFRHPHWQQWLMEEVRTIMIDFGKLLAILGIKKSVKQRLEIRD